MQQVKFSPLADITSRFDGTVADWPFEVEAAFINGVSTSFTWSDGELTLPFYSVGTVYVQFTIYLIYDAPSQYLPSDPTNPVTALVFWENRLENFITFATSIKSFESGLNEINVGNISIRIDDDWIALLENQVIMPNAVIRVYRDSQIIFKGVSTKHTVQNYAMNVNIQKRMTILDSECHFGDPPYLNRIDRSTSSAWYNGANIPPQYEGAVIPMFLGAASPYEQNDDFSEIDLGQPNPSLFVTPPSTKGASKTINRSSFIAKIIPTSATTGIIGRMPPWQVINSSPYTAALTGSLRVYSRFEQASNAPLLGGAVPGEVCIINRAVTNPIVTCARIYGKTLNRVNFHLGLSDPDADGTPPTTAYTPYENITSIDLAVKIIPSQIPNSNYTTPAVTSTPATPGGNKWLTISMTGIDLTQNETFVIFSSITGFVTIFEQLKWLLEKHGFAVDAASFANLASQFPVGTVNQIGFADGMPTLGDAIAETNQSLMTIVVFPASNDIPFLKKINPFEASIRTIYEYQMGGLRIDNEYRNQAANVLFTPKYLRSEAAKNQLFRDIDAPNTDLFSSERTLEVRHILGNVPASVLNRWDEMAEIYGAPQTNVAFDIFDDTIPLELGDCILIDHTMFRQKIMITSIEYKQIGRSIQGRYFYVNQN